MNSTHLRNECIGRTHEFTFAFAVVLLLSVFGLLLPLAAYLCNAVLEVHDAEKPLTAAFVIRMSPWAPFLVAVCGVAALVAKERWWNTPSTFTVNVITIVSVVVLGSVLTFFLFHPMFKLFEILR